MAQEGAPPEVAGSKLRHFLAYNPGNGAGVKMGDSAVFLKRLIGKVHPVGAGRHGFWKFQSQTWKEVR